jgi:hypothetical protein
VRRALFARLPAPRRVRGEASRYVAELLRAVSAFHVDPSLVAGARHADAPRIAADLAVLDEAAFDVRLEVDLDLFTAVRTGHQELIVHPRRYTS